MTFDIREWVDEIVVSGLTGLLAGGVAAMLVPGVSVRTAILTMTITNLVSGVIWMPLKALFGRRRGTAGADETKGDDHEKSGS